MGIKIYKTIGYATDGLKTVEKDGQIKLNDPRINIDKWKNHYKFSLSDFTKWWVEHQEEVVKAISVDWGERSSEQAKFNLEMIQTIDKDSNWYSGDSIIFQEEFGLANVLMLIPPMQVNSWIRHDDIIDYYEEFIKNTQEPYIKFLDKCTGIYPYLFNMVSFREPSDEVRKIIESKKIC